MVKATSAGMDTHLPQEVTTLAMATVITRTDDVKFYLTTSAVDVQIDSGDGSGVQNYSASDGVTRTNIETDAEMNVDNLDVIGVFDNVQLKETELRRGLFDFADFKIFVYNHQDTTDGVIKVFRGQLGEVIISPQGFFQVQVRSLVQVYSKQTGEHYSKDCRADLGDIRCTVPIFPDFTPRLTALKLGDFHRASSSLVGTSNPAMLVHGDNSAEDTGTANGTPTFGTQAALNTTITQFGPASIEFTPSGSDDPAEAFVSYPDNSLLTIELQAFTIETYIRFKSVPPAFETFWGASQWEEDTDQRGWAFGVTASQIRFTLSIAGTSSSLTVDRAFVPVINTWYHVAVTRDASNVLRMFVDGVQAGADATGVTQNIFDSASPVRLGKIRAATDDGPLDGFIEDFRFTPGTALYTAGFTPPSRIQTTGEVAATLTWNDYDERVYEVTTAGVSDALVPAYDSTLGNTTTDGNAVLTANRSWAREGIVTAVDGANPRRIFTVTEMTPNSGQSVAANRTPAVLGFPDDWLNGGGCLFETGNNAGRAIEIRDFIADDGVTITQDIELITDLPFDIVIGDKVRVFPGCDKTNAICISKFNSGKTFVGEPYVPGEDILGQYPNAR